MSGPYAEAANEYRKRGFAAPLPLPPRAKNPPPGGFTGSGRPAPTDKQVADWVKGKGRDLLPFEYDPSEGNIALRLTEVPKATLDRRDDLPVIYGGNNVDGWELFGIDVDDYGEKHGLAELRELEAELGPLPPTALSSARFAGWGEHRTAIRLFLVPMGYRFMGKAGNAIDIVQKRHRFMVASPSYNPDANGLYEWRWGATDTEELEGFEDGIPDVGTDDVAVLPVAWFEHLSRGGQAESDDPISLLTEGELEEWMLSLGFEEPMCDRMEKTLAKHLEILEGSASSHDKLTDAHWELIRLAAEGHDGLKAALDAYHPVWYAHAMSNSGRAPEEVQAEIGRSVHGVLDKSHPFYATSDGRSFVRAEDTCAVDKGKFDTDGWERRLNEDERKALETMDFDGMGPIVGRMEVLVPKPANEYGQHDDGNGQHFVDVYGRNVKYVDGRESWVIWDGERWHQDGKDSRLGALAFRRVRINQERFAYQTLAEAKELDDKSMAALGKSWLNWSKRSGNVGPIRAALESASRLYVEGESVAVKASIFDSKPMLLGCANGILELTEDPDIRPPRKEDYVTFNTHVPYIPWRALANSDGETLEGYLLWTEYLNTFLPDKKLQRYVQKVMGHLLVGENPEKRLVFLYGPHDTGKSTMIGGIEGALGDYAGPVDAALFRPKDLNPGLIRAVPLRVATMNEADAATMDVATVKRLTGNDMVSAEAKYSNDIFTGRPQFTIVISANNPPSIRHADAALEERLLVLPFMKTIERQARRYDRQDQISKHSGATVLSWLVEGWKMYVREGLGNQPPEVRKQQREMVAGLNPTQQFISEMLVKWSDVDEGSRMMARARERAASKGRAKPQVIDMPKDWTPRASAVYELYKRWCNGNGVDPVSHPEFTKDLGVGRPAQRKMDGTNVRVYGGIKMRALESQTGTGWRAK
jgi:putative DNA primase/helicase